MRPAKHRRAARLASQAAPLWRALPEGVFKRQLLDELAGLVHLAANDLQALWGDSVPTHARGQSRVAYAAQPSETDSSPPVTTEIPLPYTTRSPVRSAAGKARQMRPRHTPMALHTRADHALRHLLADTHAWDALSHAAHDVLLQQPAPHGACFAWIERQYLQHGPQPWSALRMALQEPSHADMLALAERLMQSDHRLVEPDQGEFLRNVHALHLEQLKRQQAVAYAQHDLAMATQLGQQIAQLQQIASSRPDEM